MKLQKLIRCVLSILLVFLVPVIVSGCIFGYEGAISGETKDGVEFRSSNDRDGALTIVAALGLYADDNLQREFAAGVMPVAREEVNRIVKDASLTAKEKAEQARELISIFNAALEPEQQGGGFEGEVINMVYDTARKKPWPIRVEIFSVDRSYRGDTIMVEAPKKTSTGSWVSRQKATVPKKGQYVAIAYILYKGKKESKRAHYFSVNGDGWSPAPFTSAR